MKVKFERVYKEYSIGDIADIDNKEELDYLINTGSQLAASHRVSPRARSCSS